MIQKDKSNPAPDEKERLKSTDKLFVIQSFANFIFFIRVLSGPVALLKFRPDIMSMISLFVHSNRA